MHESESMKKLFKIYLFVYLSIDYDSNYLLLFNNNYYHELVYHSGRNT